MKNNSPSLTAYSVALMRAAHQILDNPRVFEDPMALRIVGAQGESEIRADKRKFETRLHSYFRAAVIARSRFVEDELCLAIERGVRQYVILGAGLDTFAYRNSYSSFALRVFEVDYPATQEWKRRQLDVARIPIPDNLAFVPTDFESQSLAQHLRTAGIKTDEPTFFSWLGVTMYLRRETMMATMKGICSSAPPGSALIFDYVIPPSSLSPVRRLVFRMLARRLAGFGEPWVNFLEPGALATDLRTIGFAKSEDFGPEAINARYFKDRADRLRVGNLGHLMKAQL